MKYTTRQSFILCFIVVICVILSLIFADFLIALLIFITVVLLYLFSIKSKCSLLLKTLSLFVFFHFLIFPILYVILIKLDSQSFMFDSVIEQHEITNKKNEIEEKYKIKDLINDKKIASKLLKTNNTYLDSTFKYIDKDNIVFIDSFMLHKTSVYIFRGYPSASYATLSICNMKGEIQANILGEYGNNISKDLTIREFLTIKLSQIKYVSTNLNEDNIKVKNKEIWCYRRIIAYSINIFDTDNMKPKTKISNILFFVHKLFIGIFILAIIATAFYDFLIDKCKS